MTKFPDGIDGLARKIHDMGMKIGIYSSAGTLTCARYEGSLGHEEKDAQVWAEWGVCLISSVRISVIVPCDADSGTRLTTSSMITASTTGKKAHSSSHLIAIMP